MRTVFGIGILVLAGVCLLMAILFFRISHLFKRSPQKVGRVPATRQEIKHKKDAIIYTVNQRRHIRAERVRHLTKSVYTYTVDGKEYRIRHTMYFVPPHELPWVTSAFYLKRFPKIAYLKEGIQSFGIWAWVWLVWAAVSIGIGLGILL